MGIKIYDANHFLFTEMLFNSIKMSICDIMAASQENREDSLFQQLIYQVA